jgi:hypothetical protein
MNKPSRFRQADITRAIRAAHAAGIDDVRVEIEVDGRLVIVTGKGAIVPAKRNSIDDLMNR